MEYGDIAEIPGIGRERFAVFAFSDYLRGAGDTRLNVMHDRALTVATRRAGSLTLTDTPAELGMVAELPSGDAYDDVLALVGDGLTRGLSVEFHALRERRHGGLRTVMQAALPALAVVDDPAYPGSGVELRVNGRGIGGRLDYGRDRVTADRGKRRKERFAPGVFDDTLDDLSREIVIQIGDDAGQVLGARRAGSATFTDTPAGLEFDVPELPATSYARDFMALLTAGTIAPGLVAFYRVPPADAVADAVTIETEPDTGVEIAVINSAVLTALSIRYRAPRGNPGTVERRGIVTPAPAPARRRVWLQVLRV